MDNNIIVPSFEDSGLWGHPLNIGEDWRRFRVGTCSGLYRHRDNAYEMLSISNDYPGNKHVEATFAHFFASCKRDKADFIIRVVINRSLKSKLIERGFTALNEDDYIKRF